MLQGARSAGLELGLYLFLLVRMGLEEQMEVDCRRLGDEKDSGKSEKARLVRTFLERFLLLKFALCSGGVEGTVFVFRHPISCSGRKQIGGDYLNEFEGRD